MIRGVVTFYENTGKAPLAVVIGVAEDLKAPRDIAALEKQGWVVDDGFVATYKAFLAGRRQGDIALDEAFTSWFETVQEIDMRPSRKQVEQAVALGKMNADDGERLIALIEAEQGEAQAPPA